MNGDDVVDCSTVSQWESRLSGECGQVSILNFSCSGESHSAQTPDSVQRINNLIFADKELSPQIRVGEASSMLNIETGPI